jgi:hypothetical protein
MAHTSKRHGNEEADGMIKVIKAAQRRYRKKLSRQTMPIPEGVEEEVDFDR